MFEVEGKANGGKHRLIYTYGTLKKGFPNHPLLEDLMRKNDAVFRGSCVTVGPYPLVCGLYGVPYLIHLPGSDHQIKGELYGVTSRGLTRLDELEGVRIGHYERRPIRVVVGGPGNEAEVEAEAYFAHSSYGEALWKKRGQVGICEYRLEDALDYVKIDDRAKGKTHKSVLDELFEFVGLAPTTVGD